MNMKNPDRLMGNDDRDRDHEPRSAESGRSGPSAALIAFLILAALTVVFVFQNRERTSVDFLFFEVRARVWTSIAVAIVLGVVLDRLFLAWWRRRRRRND